MLLIELLENCFEKISKKPIISLGIIIAIGIIFRVYFTNWDIPPFAPDAFVFLIEALSFSDGDFSYFSTRFLWPMLISFFFVFFNFDSNIEYFNLMRIITILISVASVPLIYHIAKNYVDKKYAIIASAIFAFEPNIIENSLFLITEPLFILCGLLSLYFLIQKNNKLIILSFLFAGLSFDTRLNGIVLILVVLIFCSLKLKRKEISIKEIILGISILIITIVPHIYFPLEQGNIPFFFYITSFSTIISDERVLSATYSSSDAQTGFSILKNSIGKELIHLVRISIPYLIFFIPIGVFSSLKKIDINKKILFLSIIISFVVSFPQYFISAEYRNLLFLIPIFCILSAIGIQRIFHDKKYQNFLILLLLIGIISTSFGFLKFQLNEDLELIEEKEKFGKIVVNDYSGRIMGGPYNEISHNIPNAKLGNMEEGNLYNEKIAILVTHDPVDSNEKLTDTISKLGIDYIIVDNIKNNRYPIFQDIFDNEKKYSQFEKVFDSKDEYKKYKVKIFKVNSSPP